MLAMSPVWSIAIHIQNIGLKWRVMPKTIRRPTMALAPATCVLMLNMKLHKMLIAIKRIHVCMI
jgi:hypothetical protein